MTSQRIQTFRDALSVPFRHKGKILLALMAGIGVGIAYALLSPKVYRSEARLLIRLGRESVAVDPTATGFDRVSVSQSRMAEVQSELQIATSSDLVETLVAQLSPAEVTGRSNASTASAVAHVQLHMSAQVIEDSYSIQLSYEDSSPERAQQILDRLVDLYLEKHVQVHRTFGSNAFFTRELETIRKQIRERESQLQALRRDAGVVARNSQEDTLVKRVDELSGALAEADLVIAGLTAGPEVALDMANTDPSLGAVVTRLRELRMQKIELLSKYPDESRQVEAISELIGGAEQMLEETREAAMNTAIARRKILLARQEKTQAELATLGNSALELDRLERDLATFRASESKFAASAEQARIDRALELERISNVSVVQPASLSMQPVGPKTTLCLAVGVLLGLFGAFAAAATAEVLDDSVRRPEDGEAATGLPTVASVPQLPQAALTAPPLDSSASGTAFQPLQDGDVMSGWPHLAQAMDLGVGTGTSVLALSSAHRGAGATSLACMLAADLARRGLGPVLLVDGNLKDPDLTRQLGCEHQEGVGDLLAYDEGKKSFRPRRLAIPDLFFFPAGSLNNGSTPLVRHARVERFVLALRKNFRHVVIDLPTAPNGGVGVSLARAANQTLLVAEAGRTRGQVLRAARDALGAHGVMPAGIVLNKRKFPIPNWLYRRL